MKIFTLQHFCHQVLVSKLLLKVKKGLENKTEVILQLTSNEEKLDEYSSHLLLLLQGQIKALVLIQ